MTRVSVELVVVGGNDNLKRAEACAWIDGAMTAIFSAIKGINSYVENKGHCSGRFWIQIETDIGVFRVSSTFV